MRDRLRRLHDVTNEMLGIMDLNQLYARVADAARSLDTADAASLMIVDHEENALVIRGQSGLSEDYAASQRIPLERALRHYQRGAADAADAIEGAGAASARAPQALAGARDADGSRSARAQPRVDRASGRPHE